MYWSKGCSLTFGLSGTGQANYGFANNVVNEICMARKAARVPGMSLAIQWGAVGDVGFLAQHETVR